MGKTCIFFRGEGGADIVVIGNLDYHKTPSAPRWLADFLWRSIFAKTTKLSSLGDNVSNQNSSL